MILGQKMSTVNCSDTKDNKFRMVITSQVVIYILHQAVALMKEVGNIPKTLTLALKVAGGAPLINFLQTLREALLTRKEEHPYLTHQWQITQMTLLSVEFLGFIAHECGVQSLPLPETQYHMQGSAFPESMLTVSIRLF